MMKSPSRTTRRASTASTRLAKYCSRADTRQACGAMEPDSITCTLATGRERPPVSRQRRLHRLMPRMVLGNGGTYRALELVHRPGDGLVRGGGAVAHHDGLFAGQPRIEHAMNVVGARLRL